MQQFSALIICCLILHVCGDISCYVDNNGNTENGCRYCTYMEEDDDGDETVTGGCWKSSSAPYIAFSDGYGGEIKFTKINECGPQFLGQRSYQLYICNSDKCNKDCGGTGTPIIKPTPAPTTTTESTSTITSTVPTSSPNDGKNTAIGQVLGFGFTSILMLFITQFLG